ncbi:MAG: M15 family metallopeptidase [Lachnospiraceae bacterium]|nr:M15 family metallopeptidase [Lachnospiraceae bacterium]
MAKTDDASDDGEQALGYESLEEDDEPEEEAEAEKPDPSASFFAEEISDEVFARMKGKSFSADCTLSRDELRYLHILYKDIDGNPHEGEMVCNAAIADKLIDIFRQLYEASYPIESMSLVDDFDADDDASMAANNTSCFNFRFVTGTKKISKHGYGMAVDLNPRYNPYIYTRDGVQHIEPENGIEYADRSNDFDYKIDKDDLAYKLFTQAGFSWGGSWKNSKDYQHFQMD